MKTGPITVSSMLVCNYFDLESIRLGTGGLAGFDVADGGLGLPEGTGGFAWGLC